MHHLHDALGAAGAIFSVFGLLPCVYVKMQVYHKADCRLLLRRFARVLPRVLIVLITRKGLEKSSFLQRVVHLKCLQRTDSKQLMAYQKTSAHHTLTSFANGCMPRLPGQGVCVVVGWGGGTWMRPALLAESYAALRPPIKPPVAPAFLPCFPI